MICLQCDAVRASGPACEVCGHELVTLSQLHLDALIERRIARLLDRSEAAGLIDGLTRAGIARLAFDVVAPVEPESPPLAVAAAAVAVTGLEPPPLPRRNPDPLDHHASMAESAAQTSALLLHTPDVAGASEGLGALAMLDEPKGPGLVARAWPVFSENVGWFIGALLVLAGSVYGVREAWNALGDVARHAVVAGALLAYHAGFVGAGAALSRASVSAGRVLATIGAGLLPMTFAVLASLASSSPVIGLAAGAVTLLAVAPTLASVARRWALTDERLVAKAMWPALAAQLLVQLPWLGEGVALLPIAGVAGLWLVTRAGPGLVSLPVLGFALYGHLALELATGTLDSLDLAMGALPLALIVMRAALLATRLHQVATRQEERDERPALVTSEVVLLAVLGTVSLFATGNAWSDDLDAGTALASAGAVVLAAYAFRRAAGHHPAARHFVVPLTTLAGSLIVAELAPDRPDLWSAGATLATCGMLWWVRRQEGPPVEQRWASALALFAVGVSWSLARGDGPWWGVIAASAPVALTWTFADQRRQWLNYGAGIAVMACIAAWRVPLSPEVGWFETALLSGAVLLLAGLVHQRVVTESTVRPWADLSLVALLAAPAFLFAVDTETTPARAALALAVTGTLLVLRGLLDRSTLVAVPGFTLLALAGVAWLSPDSPATRALLLAGASLAFIVIGSFRKGPPVPWTARRLLGGIELPWAAPPRALLSMAVGAAGAVLGVLALDAWSGWLVNRVPEGRLHATLAAVVLAATALTTFLFRSLETLHARGSAVTLGLTGILIALAAISHRLDRPRALEDAAWRATLVGLVVWGIAVALQRYGKALAERLGRPSHGGLYHLLAHLAVVLIGLRIVAKSVPSPGLATTPPLALAGPAVLAGLLAWSLRSSLSLHVTHALVLPAAMLVATQGRLLGGAGLDVRPELPLLPGALPGAAIATLAFAAFAWLAGRRASPEESFDSSRIPAQWTLVGAGVLFASAFHFAPLPEALLVVAAGAIVWRTPSRRPGLAAASLGVLLAWHAVANQSALISSWVGPASMASALAVVGLLAKPSSVRVAALLTSALFIEGLLYALAAGAPADAQLALPNALEQAARGLSRVGLGTWPVTVVLLMGTLVQARQAVLKTRAEPVAGVTRSLVQAAILSGATVLAACFTWSDGIAALAWSTPALVLAAAGWHLLTLRPADSSAPLLRGLRAGRDLLLVSAGLAPAMMSASNRPIDETPLTVVVMGLVGAMLVAGHAVWRERRTRHVYGIQLAAVGTYAFVRNALGLDLPPEVDATVVLALGFLLLGVTIVARRLDVPPVAIATRRFASLLPLAVVWLMPADATQQAAALSAASGALWASLAWAGQSRWLGSLGAAALNFALLVFALASGLDGVEVFLAPLGLMLLALGQIFAASLNDGARLTIRVLGALALYLPSALQVALQVGNARDGLYPVLFGATCLVGVGLGVLLRIRAYLVLGTGFLALDVIASLFHAGRRDHRIAVLVLSLSGLAVLGLMIYVTLKREKVQRLRASLREQLASWD